MPEKTPGQKRWRRILGGAVTIIALVVLADFMMASWVLWSSYDTLTAGLRNPAESFEGWRTYVEVAEVTSKSPTPRVVAKTEVCAKGDVFRLALDYEGNNFELERRDGTGLWAPKSRTLFAGERSDFAETCRVMNEVGDVLPRPHFLQRIGISGLPLVIHPLIIGVTRVNNELYLRLWFSRGTATVGLDGWLREAKFAERGGKKTWLLTLRREPAAMRDVARQAPSEAKRIAVPAAELDHSLAAALRIFALQWQPVPKEPDRVAREGNGWLEVKDGRRILHLKGTAREIGFQHGRLLAPNVKRLTERVAYGVGLGYSLEKGQWFLREAQKLLERQRPHIPPEYFEEMQGLAEGAGVPLSLVHTANIFPEFFHCSGAALFGKATKGGILLHARVLDYMTEVGLQDDAVLMAVERTGARRFVNVSYAGFIGSVTGMNEKQVAIGEMGGRGEGQWDGTPMGFLVRGALENCDTLEQALDYMRSRKRTCEYYYVISDGKSKSARGVAATPEKFEVIGPGKYDPRLPEPVEDAVLLSAGDRYKELVKRVREKYGRIGPEEFMQIIAQPVAMKSNLHDAIFAPEKLTLWVAHATRNAPACNQPYACYTWAKLFQTPP